jgi:hypothetical protein
MNRLLLRTAINDLMNAVRIITSGNQFHLRGSIVWQPLAEGTLYHNHTAATGQIHGMQSITFEVINANHVLL